MLPTVQIIAPLLGSLATASAAAFAGYQLWRLNVNARIESHRSLIESEREIWFKALTTPEVEDIVKEVWGISSPGTAKLTLFWAAFLDSCEHMYLRREARVMTSADWGSMESYIGRLIRAPSFPGVWHDVRGDYVPAFARYVDGRMREGEGAPSRG